MSDDMSGSGQGTPPTGGEQPEFMDQVIAQTLAALAQQGPDWYRASGEEGQALVANASKLALWIAGVRPGGLRVLRLLSGYEVEITPQDPFGFANHLMQALVGEAVTTHNAQTPDEATRALFVEVSNIANQVTSDIATFIVRTLLLQMCGGLLQQTLAEQQEQREVEARRGTGKRDEEAPTPMPTAEQTGGVPPEAPPVQGPPRPKLIRPGQPTDDGPPAPLIFPGRR